MCSTSKWPGWRRWRTRCPGSSPAGETEGVGEDRRLTEHRATQTLRMTGSSVVVTVWKILLMLFSCFSLRVVIRSNALS